jgi:hypothetical protein
MQFHLMEMFARTHYGRSAFSFGSPIPTWNYYYAAVQKTTGETITVGTSSPGVIADASEKTGLPRDEFELQQISKEEYERRKAS